MSLLLSVFLTFAQVGLFSIGGGYAAIPLISDLIVQKNHWLNADEFLDLVSIAEITPGPIAINAATFVGIRIAGPFGAVAATLGCIFPALILVSILSVLYRKYRTMGPVQQIMGYIRPTVIALIASAAVAMAGQVFLREGQGLLEKIDWVRAGIGCGALYLIRTKKAHSIAVMFACGAVYLAMHLLMKG